MNTAVAPAPATPAAIPSMSLITRFAMRAGVEPERLARTLKDTVFKLPNGGEVTNEQLLVLLSVAEKYNLDPMVKEIHAFVGKGGGVHPTVGYDGWIAMMIRHPQYDGHEYTDGPDEKGMPAWIECRVFRKDRSHATTIREYMVECKRGTDTWAQWPRRMLRNKATIQAARAAFGFSGISDPDEAERILAAESARVAEPAAAPGIAAINSAVQARQQPAPALEHAPDNTVPAIVGESERVPETVATETTAPAAETKAAAGETKAAARDTNAAPTFAEVAERIHAAKSIDDLNVAIDAIRGIENRQHQREANLLAADRRAVLVKDDGK